MTQLLAHPVAQSVVVPLAVSAALLLALRNHRIAAAALPAALLVATLLVVGVVGWPPRTGMHKLPWLLGGALALGIALDLTGQPRARRLPAGGAYLALALAWLAWPQRGALSSEFAAALLGLLAGGMLVIGRLARAELPGTRPAAMLGVAAAALVLVAFQAGSLAIAQLAAALAFACAAWCVLGLRVAPLPFAAAGAVGGGGALMLLVAVTALLTDVSYWALAPLALVFLVDDIAARVGAGTSGGLIELLAIALLAAVPALVAVGLAMWLATGDDLYYP